MDIVIQVIFFLAAALIVGSAVMVVTVKNIIHAALWLISSFMGVGILYLLMEAEFLAVAQVLIYVGAVSVLMLFAIMLTRQVTSPSGSQFYPRWWLSLAVVVALFGAILVPTLAAQTWVTFVPAPDRPIVIAGPEELGRGFMSEFMLPFQAAAVLLMIALIGAIVIAYEEMRRRRVLTLAERYEIQRQQQASAAAAEEQNGTGNGVERQESSDDTDTTADDDAVIKNVPRH